MSEINLEAWGGHHAKAEAALVWNAQIAKPEYLREVLVLWRSRCQTSHPCEIIYLTAHAFTEDTGLWNYANLRLEALRNWFYQR